MPVWRLVLHRFPIEFLCRLRCLCDSRCCTDLWLVGVPLFPARSSLQLSQSVAALLDARLLRPRRLSVARPSLLGAGVLLCVHRLTRLAGRSSAVAAGTDPHVLVYALRKRLGGRRAKLAQRTRVFPRFSTGSVEVYSRSEHVCFRGSRPEVSRCTRVANTCVSAVLDRKCRGVLA